MQYKQENGKKKGATSIVLFANDTINMIYIILVSIVILTCRKRSSTRTSLHWPRNHNRTHHMPHSTLQATTVLAVFS